MGCLKLHIEQNPTFLRVVNSAVEVNSNNCVSAYLYKFKGFEDDSEVKGEGNSYTTEFRQYDPRLGRWLTIDPLVVDFPSFSPYVAFNNNPIYFVDPNGLSSKPPKNEKLLKDAATKTGQKAIFGSPYYSRETTHHFYYAGHVSNLNLINGPSKGNVLYYVGSMKPSKVLDFTYKLIEHGMLTLDCGFYVALVYAESYRQSLGNKKFNEMFKQENGGYAFLLAQGGFWNNEGTQTKYNNTNQDAAKNHADLAPIGTIITLTADDESLVYEDYKHENFIKVGDNQYAAFPFTKGVKPTFLTLEEVIQTTTIQGNVYKDVQTEYKITSIVELPLE